ncbi:MAG TPA: type II toxin-antitoxin system VapC family toxin [Casimicrobiaceae bacterium]
MKAADTSVVIAAFASWHESHEGARRALDSGMRMIEHCALETYSVLTRLPAPHRSSGTVVQQFLMTRFPQPFLRLSTRAYKDFIQGLPDHGVTGGTAYDALVAATAAACGAELVSCDRRALPVYERYGVRTLLLL